MQVCVLTVQVLFSLEVLMRSIIWVFICGKNYARQKDANESLMIERVAKGPRQFRNSASLGLVKSRALVDSSNVQPDERVFQ